MKVRVLASAAVAVAAIAAPAHAAAPRTAGVGACVHYSQNEVRGYCDMTTLPGNYTLTLVSQARYAFARVWCNGRTAENPNLFVNLWNTDADYPIASVSGYLPGPQCTLEVAAGVGGTAVAFVHPSA